MNCGTAALEDIQSKIESGEVVKSREVSFALYQDLADRLRRTATTASPVASRRRDVGSGTATDCPSSLKGRLLATPPVAGVVAIGTGEVPKPNAPPGL
jgi:hypothetical protein